MSTESKGASLVRVAVAYAACIGAGGLWLWLGPSTDRAWLDALIADLIATLVIFGFSRAHGNSSFYDAYWSVIPPLLFVYWWAESSTGIGDLGAWLCLIVMLAWAIRLTGNWIYSFPGLHHEDWRYPMLRDKAPSSAAAFATDVMAIHFFPTLQVFLATVPAYLVVQNPGSAGTLAFVALLVGLGAVTLQLTADTQMHRFVAQRQQGQVMDSGLWAWSRHPNYLGELGFWLSIALFGLGADPGAWWWVFAGFAAMVAMFLGASIPMMEERSLARRPDYQRIIDTVPKLLLLPPGTRKPAQ